MTPESNFTRDNHINKEGADVQMAADEDEDKVQHQVLLQKIRNQIEFYLGDSNLAKDSFLKQKLEKDPQLELSVFLDFNRVKALLTFESQG